MKNILIKTSILFLTIGILATGLHAQTTAPQSSATVKTHTAVRSQSVSHGPETREQWIKRYGYMKPKLEEMAANAKSEKKNPEFTTQVSRMNQMALAYKTKIDNWDKQPEDKRDSYNNQLRASNKELNEQYLKVKGMWNKMHPEAPAQSKEMQPLNSK